MTNKASYALVNFSTLTGHPSDASESIDAIVITDNVITGVGCKEIIPRECRTVDLAGYTLSPGFIDLQLNGCGGVLFNSNISEETLDIMHATNLRFGCTSFLPTLITCSDDDMIKAIDVVRKYRSRFPGRVPGLHLEGPYINQERSGIHDVNHIRSPSAEMVNYLCNNADVIAMITLAPEVCPKSVVSQLKNAGIVVSIGHSNATFEEVREAEQAGASFVTHLFNAMSQMQNRDPGVVGATLSSGLLGAGIIADGYHLHWNNLLISQRLLNDRLVLVTDATAAAGSDIESFEFGGKTVYHDNGKCTGKDGTLGGSALTMIEAVQNCIQQGISPERTIQMATHNPAKVLGLSHVLGEIRKNYRADLVMMDESYSVVGSISDGEFHYAQSS